MRTSKEQRRHKGLMTPAWMIQPHGVTLGSSLTPSFFYSFWNLLPKEKKRDKKAIKRREKKTGWLRRRLWTVEAVLVCCGRAHVLEPPGDISHSSRHAITRSKWPPPRDVVQPRLPHELWPFCHTTRLRNFVRQYIDKSKRPLFSPLSSCSRFSPSLSSSASLPL